MRWDGSTGFGGRNTVEIGGIDVGAKSRCGRDDVWRDEIKTTKMAAPVETKTWHEEFVKYDDFTDDVGLEKGEQLIVDILYDDGDKMTEVWLEYYGGNLCKMMT